FSEAQGELNLHAWICLSGGSSQCRIEQHATFLAGKPAIGELKRVNANSGVGVVEERLPIGRTECAELIECAQRSDNRRGFRRFVRKDFSQRRRCRLFSAFHEEALRGLSPPEKRAGTFSRECSRVERAQVSSGSGRRIAVREAIDATEIVAGINSILLLEMARNGRVILDDFPVVIGNPNAAIWPVRQVHWVTPGVGAGGEFGFLLTGCPSKFQRWTLWLDERAVDKIARR